jgi:hypothetical protein
LWARGGWCYYDTAFGKAQWQAPAGSTALIERRFTDLPAPFDAPPPKLDSRICIGTQGAQRENMWTPVYEDQSQLIVLIVHQVTGAARQAPWVSLRNQFGRIYFANLITRQTRWFPPHLWMEGWVRRTCMGDTSGHAAACDDSWLSFIATQRKGMLPPDAARLRVEGGAPYLHEQGAPPYPPDELDTRLTHPLATISTATTHSFCNGLLSHT